MILGGQDAEVGPIEFISYIGTESMKEQDAASKTRFLWKLGIIRQMRAYKTFHQFLGRLIKTEQKSHF